MPITRRHLKEFSGRSREQIREEIDKLQKIAERAASYVSLDSHPAWKDLCESILDIYLHVETFLGVEKRDLPEYQQKVKLVTEIKEHVQSKIKEAQDTIKKIDELRSALTEGR